jgi:hypothetical protein
VKPKPTKTSNNKKRKGDLPKLCNYQLPFYIKMEDEKSV